MDAIKQAVVQTLEKQGVITQLKAQLRAQVFIAVDEYDSATSGSGLAAKTSVPSRNSLLSDSDGQIVIQLVLDLLDTCNFAFTKKVFQPELGPTAPEGGRQAVAQKLGLKPSSTDEPLLLTLLKAFKSGSSGQPAESSSGGAAAAVPPKPATNSGATAAPTSAVPAPAPASAPSAAPSIAVSSGAGARGGSTPAAPLPRLDALPTVGKPALAPLPQLGSAAAKPQELPPAQPSASAVAAAKPNPEPSAEETAYSDEDFEEEPVEEEVEEEGAGAAADDDEDYATALGYKASPPTGSKGGVGDSLDATRDRPGGGPGPGTSSSRGRTALDADLMAGDRSFGISNELAGLDAGNSGGLSYSADGFGAANDLRGSLSSSQAMLSPISEGTPKLAKLEPLRPLGASKLSPLAPLAPLPTLGTLSSSLTSSKEDPLGAKGPKALAPLGGPVRKSLADIEKEKDELRRLGLLQSGDSLSNSIEVESRPRAANIYDAEMSVSASMDDGGPWSGGPGGSGGGIRDDRLPPFGSKGLSMDLRDTGLSASDRSGDIEHMGVDLAETAEWH